MLDCGITSSLVDSIIVSQSIRHTFNNELKVQTGDQFENGLSTSQYLMNEFSI